MNLKRIEISTFKTFVLLLYLTFYSHAHVFSQQNTYEESVLGLQAPLFELTDLDGKAYKLSELQKEYTVVLNFWFMACGPCIQEFNALNQLKERFKDEKVLFLAITTDEDVELLRVFLKRYSFHYHIIAQGKAIAKNYQVYLCPSNLVIDTKGKIIFAKSAYHEDIELLMTEAIQQGLDQTKE